MHQLKPWAAIGLLIFMSTATAREPRFSGSAGLAKTAESSTSANGQFSLSADLRPAVITEPSGRFALSAKLQPDAKSIATACGPAGTQLFANGFE